MKKIKVNIILIAYTKIFLLADVKEIWDTFNRKLNPIKERRPWFLLEKNPVNAELMHIYPKYISMAYYIMFLWIPERDETRRKVTWNVLVNALHAFHRLIRRNHVKGIRTRELLSSVNISNIEQKTRSGILKPILLRNLKMYSLIIKNQ